MVEVSACLLASDLRKFRRKHVERVIVISEPSVIIRFWILTRVAIKDRSTASGFVRDIVIQVVVLKAALVCMPRCFRARNDWRRRRIVETRRRRLAFPMVKTNDILQG
jgi:hypothetical protein